MRIFSIVFCILNILKKIHRSSSKTFNWLAAVNKTSIFMLIYMKTEIKRIQNLLLLKCNNLTYNFQCYCFKYKTFHAKRVTHALKILIDGSNCPSSWSLLKAKWYFQKFKMTVPIWPSEPEKSRMSSKKKQLTKQKFTTDSWWAFPKSPYGRLSK